MNLFNTIDTFFLQLAGKIMSLADFFHINRKLLMQSLLWISLTIHFLIININEEPFCFSCRIMAPIMCVLISLDILLNTWMIDRAQESEEGLMVNSPFLNSNVRLLFLACLLLNTLTKGPWIVQLGINGVLYLMANYHQPPGKRLKDVMRFWFRNVSLRPALQR